MGVNIEVNTSILHLVVKLDYFLRLSWYFFFSLDFTLNFSDFIVTIDSWWKDSSDFFTYIILLLNEISSVLCPFLNYEAETVSGCF